MKHLLLIALLFIVAGCRLAGHYTLIDPIDNQVLAVGREDVVSFELEENATTGYRWMAKCDDPEIEIGLEHVPAKVESGFCGAPGKAAFTLKVGRSFTGPAMVKVYYQRSWEKSPIKEFTLSLFCK